MKLSEQDIRRIFDAIGSLNSASEPLGGFTVADTALYVRLTGDETPDVVGTISYDEDGGEYILEIGS